MQNEPLWYKDAIIYEAHVRSFYDSTASGIGDFHGLMKKLPYLQDLGISCLWLLPFYPSPLRDDGYDIADYTTVNPIYGMLDDFKRFVDAAHEHQIRVLTELVVNHTSDQHPWFQRARHAPKGSPERDYYVWSDSDERYAGTRIIFVDTEKSNWTFDPVAGQYYWHRFFSHQPDLNIDNPEVLQAVIDVMRFWFDLGVDAMRLDGIPYLIERDGTINENLPETHDVLKRIRRELDAEYPGRVLMAEANQWPADVAAYFGDGDECHMAYHFPLMPRMFMALRQEERHPIVEIMSQTPEVPPNCQWAIFLRNHDELTLEMVTDEERDYMYAQYAADPLMRLNLGIRRRLAPLMEFSRPRIELMNSLLFSMPGTPIIYYGDEIGMGDNVHLGDRNGVRTPMQWNSDRNGGFSRCDPSQLFLPVNQDTIGGYDAINVEAEQRSPFSLLNWMKRMIALRKQHPVFGRGAIEFLPTPNRKVLTYLRRDETESVLCVANLARTVQPVELDLSQFAGLTPVEMLGETTFPRIGDLPYFLTLAPYGFYWFRLQESVDLLAAATVPGHDETVTLPAIYIGVVWESLLDGVIRNIVERTALPSFLARQRWFASKAKTIVSARFVDWGRVRAGLQPAFLSVVEVTFDDGVSENYLLPLSMLSGEPATTVERDTPDAVLALITGARNGVLCDGTADDTLCAALLNMIREGGTLTTRAGHFAAFETAAEQNIPVVAPTPIARSRLDQSNTSVTFDRTLIMKVFRRQEPGPNPDIEIGRYLTSRRFARVPRLLGGLAYTAAPETESSSAIMVQAFVEHQGNGWQVALDDIDRYYEQSYTRKLPRSSKGEDVRRWMRTARRMPPASVVQAIGTYLTTAEVLGRRTGELHAQLATGDGDDPEFTADPFEPGDTAALAEAMRTHANTQLDLLDRVSGQLDASRYEMARYVLAHRDDLLGEFDSLVNLIDAGQKIRCHGDFHLGQILVASGDVFMLDFEGEPSRSMAEQRIKVSPIRDVAGMLRSFSYAAAAGARAATLTRPENRERLIPWVALWDTWVSATFLKSYLQATKEATFMPGTPEALDVLIQTYTLDKAVYELGYELNNRPDWVHVPLGWLQRHLERH